MRQFIDAWKYRITNVTKNAKIMPVLAIIEIGSHGMTAKIVQDCEELGIVADIYNFPEYTTLTKITKKIKRIKADGIIVLAPHLCNLDIDEVYDSIQLRKDVGGLKNTGMFKNSMAQGLIKYLEEIGININQKKIVIFGRAGRPVVESFADLGCTVTVGGSHCNVREVAEGADIVIGMPWYAQEIRDEDLPENCLKINCGTRLMEHKDDLEAIGTLQRLQIIQNVCKAFMKYNPHEIITRSENDYDRLRKDGEPIDDYAKKQYVAAMLELSLGEQIAEEYCEDYGIERFKWSS